jgi:hypothetical protein
MDMKITSADPNSDRLGPMFGSPLTGGENEGMGPGRCFAVTVGGASDGHDAAVLDAVRSGLQTTARSHVTDGSQSFHPELNILATSSVNFRQTKFYPIVYKWRSG